MGPYKTLDIECNPKRETRRHSNCSLPTLRDMDRSISYESLRERNRLGGFSEHITEEEENGRQYLRSAIRYSWYRLSDLILA
jgi:hypothetical protein